MKKFSITVIISLLLLGCDKSDDCESCEATQTKVHSAVTYTDTWTPEGHGFFSDLGTLSIVTPPVVYNGTVQVFLSADSTNTEWLNMPWSFSQSGTITTYNFSYSLDGVRIHVFNIDSSQVADPGMQAFKIVATTL